MRKRSSILCLLAAAALSAQVAAQRPPTPVEEVFAAASGEWLGRLTYLDYKDNPARVELPVTLTWRAPGGRIEYAFTYTEPNGRTVKGDPNTLRASAGGVLINQEEWAVESSTADAARQQYSVVLTRRGSDNDEPAALRRTFALSGGELRLTNEARPAGADQYFIRNEYKLKRRP